MNLHNIASGVISAVNPMQTWTIQASTGSTTSGDGRRVPTYADPLEVTCQAQSLQYNDIAQMDGLNVQGIKSKIYLNGHFNGAVRAQGKGGDLLTDPLGNVWLVVIVLETFPDWCSLGVVLQDGS